jgi:hypothetical protein
MLKLFATLGALAVPAASFAAVVSGTLTGGTTFSVDAGVFIVGVPPTTPALTLGSNNIENPNVYAWNETQNFTLGAPLAIDQDAGGLPGVLAAGTRVASHGFAFDPDSGGPKTATGTVTFARPILGLILFNPNLFASDFLDNKGFTFLPAGGNRGLEHGDTVSFAGNVLTYDLIAGNPGDNIRVLTAVPEPATWAMLVAGFGLVGYAARRRSRIAIA